MKNGQNRTLHDIVARQNRALMGKNNCNHTHVRGLVGRLTRRIARWTGRGIPCDSEEWASSCNFHQLLAPLFVV